MNTIIKDFQQKIRMAHTESDKQNLIIELKNYVQTQPKDIQRLYRETVIANIESKFEVMDKLIDTYETMKKDYLQFA